MGIQASVPMIGPVDDRKLPAKATPVDAGAESRAANLPAPAAAASAKRSDGSDSITYRDVVDAKRPWLIGLCLRLKLPLASATFFALNGVLKIGQEMVAVSPHLPLSIWGLRSNPKKSARTDGPGRFFWARAKAPWALGPPNNIKYDFMLIDNYKKTFNLIIF